MSSNKFVLLFKTLREEETISVRCQFFHYNMIRYGLLHLCRRRLCSLNVVRHDSAPLWNGRLWERGEAAMRAGVQRGSGAGIDCHRRRSLTHMVKCWGICFSLCCALGSPPRRTRGGSNTAATVKKEDNPPEIRINPQRRDCKHNILLPPLGVCSALARRMPARRGPCLH